MDRRRFLHSCCGGAAGAVLSSWIAKPAWADETEKPNIVYLMADDLGWKDVGFHGSEIKTPNLDALAASGVKLEQFYVQPLCSPTRSSLLTGRYPIRQGLQVGVVWPGADWGLPLEERTLAQALKQAGYRTAIAGKWHLGMVTKEYLPSRRGFDHAYGMYLGQIDYNTHERDGGLDWHRNEEALREEGYSTNLIAQEAVRVIEGHDAAKPLFLYVPFNAPHAPLQAPQEYVDRYAHIANETRRQYAAMVTCMDDAVGKILAALEKKGLRKNTLILFNSDNGGPTQMGANNGALRGSKGGVYEGGVRVPAFAAWPGKLKEGAVCKHPLHITDWFPTLLNLAGAPREQPLPLDGVDIWPTLTEGKPSAREEILHNIEPSGGALRRGDWKIVLQKSPTASACQLFNIAEDPDEKNDLAAKHPEKVKELSERLDRYAKEAVAPKSGRARPKVQAPKVWEPAK